MVVTHRLGFSLESKKGFHRFWTEEGDPMIVKADGEEVGAVRAEAGVQLWVSGQASCTSALEFSQEAKAIVLRVLEGAHILSTSSYFYNSPFFKRYQSLSF